MKAISGALLSLLVLSCATKPSPSMQDIEEARLGERQPGAAGFEDLEGFVSTLNTIIAEKQYDEWLEHLSGDYTLKYGNPAILAEISLSPKLQENGIVLKNLHDYFVWVVVPSRFHCVWDDIVLSTGEEHVTVHSSFDNRPVMMYQLEKINGVWKIGI